jgi:hypothetical protein
MRLTEILLAFPYILLAMAIVAGRGPGLTCLGIFGPGKAEPREERSHTAGAPVQ